MTEEEIRKSNEDLEKYNTTGFGRWSWFSMIEKLANGDITKFEAVSNTNLILSLNLLLYWKERDKEIEKNK